MGVWVFVCECFLCATFISEIKNNCLQMLNSHYLYTIDAHIQKQLILCTQSPVCHLSS